MQRQSDEKAENLTEEDLLHWGSVLFSVMREGLRAKLTDTRRLCQEEALLRSGNRIIVEASAEDKFWGTVNGEGENFLGRLLMEVRDEIATPGHYMYIHTTG